MLLYIKIIDIILLKALKNEGEDMSALPLKWRIITAICSAILLITILSVGILGYILLDYIHTAPKLNINDLELDYTSFIYGSEGQELVRLHDEKNRVWVSLDDIPTSMRNAIIATEDQRFWQHKGVDYKRTIMASFNLVFHTGSTFGGSTITQQLVKNLTLNNDVTIKRKIQEMWQAMQLEKQIGKEKVLELYLNTVFFGGGAYGVQAAAHSYFGKNVSELSLAELASIIGITQYPEKYNPFLNPKENKNKQEIVLKKMLEFKYINEDEYALAIAQSLNFTRGTVSNSNSKYSYFVDQVLSDVLEDLQKEKGYTRAFASKLLYTGGLKIYATINTDVQEAMEKVFADDNNFPDDESDVKTNSAMVTIDPYSGEIKGLVGGRGEKTAMRTLNRATQSVRQPGSTIKPISVYAPAIDQALITPETVFEDAPYTKDGWSPKNWYDGFKGNVTVKTAIEQSMNIIAVKVLELVGIDRSFDFLKNNLGITTLVEKDVRDGKEYTDKLLNSLALGGLTDGVTVKEMAAAYAPFANKGVYIKPHTYLKVVDHSGSIIIDKETIESHIALREQTAFTMTQMLEGVVKNGTGAYAQFSKNMPVAGKTGTTSEDKDRWFVGYTPYYVGAVWFGYDSPKPMQQLLKGRQNPAVIIWKNVMELIHKNLAVKEFPQLTGNGRGTLSFDDKRIYEGEMKNGKANGYGIMTYPNGDRYWGDFVDNLRDGRGILLYSNGNKYEGEFKSDNISGNGNLAWVNGDKYSGEWLNGKFNGDGTFNWISGDSYSGGWLNEKFNGMGTFKWAGGNKYEGNWLNGSFEGVGTFYWASGETYTGQWHNGEKVK